MPRTYFVYVLASESRKLYVGVTKDLVRRLAQHRTGSDPNRYAFRHGAIRLVHFEHTTDVRADITREKELKRWTRRRKVALVETRNPGWRDLSDGW